MGFTLARMYANGGVASGGVSTPQVITAEVGGGTYTLNLIDADGSLIGTMTAVADRRISSQAREMQLRGRRP